MSVEAELLDRFCVAGKEYAKALREHRLENLDTEVKQFPHIQILKRRFETLKKAANRAKEASYSLFVFALSCSVLLLYF